MAKHVAASRTGTYQALVKAIFNHVDDNTDFLGRIGQWYVGITRDPRARYAKHKAKLGRAPKFWKHWHAGSHRIARSLETKFHRDGMRESNALGGATLQSTYIYVFKITPGLFD